MMTFFKDFSLGLKSYSSAVKFLKANRLLWYFIFPIIFNIILFSIGYASTVSLSSELFVHINNWLAIDTWEFMGSGVLVNIIFFFLNIILRLLFISVFAFIGGYFVLILLSPVFAILSEKIESILTGEKYPFDAKQLFKDIWRGIKLAVRNLGIELAITIVLFALSFIPVVGLITGPLLFLVTAYFYGFSFIDYALERKNFNVKQSIDYVKTNKGLAVGNGTTFSAVLLIPFVGVLISSFVSIIAVTAATIVIIEQTIQEKNEAHKSL